MKFNYCLTAFLLFFNIVAYSQEELSAKKVEKQANKAFSNEDYHTALPLYKQLYSLDSVNTQTNYRLGVSYFNLGEKGKAVPYFQFVKKNKTNGDYQNVPYLLAKALHSQQKFAEAGAEYTTFLSDMGAGGKMDAEMMKEVKKNIRNCEVGKVLAANPVKCSIKNLGTKVNTAGEETSPVISPDGKYLYFSAKNHEIESVHTDKEHKNEDPGDIYTLKDMNGNFSRPYLLSSNTRSDFLDAPVFANKEGNILYFLKVIAGRSNDIYYSEHNGADWTAPKAMGEPFNSAGNETGFSMSPDGNTAFFSSDRSGGFGGQDIYMVKKVNGAWGKAENLGNQFNSEYSEEMPFVSADGKLLYFCSDGMNSVGGYDLFKSRLKDNKFSQPENMGVPVNSSDDEKHLTWYAHGIKGYFSSKRPGSIGGEDLYFIQIYDTTISPAKYLTYFQNEKLFEEFMAKPDTGKTLEDAIYFDFNSTKVAEFSLKKLNRVLLLLNTYPTVKLEIQGYTDNKGTEDANHNVSVRRANAVYNYLLHKGVNADRLKPVGLAAAHPVSDGDSDMEIARNRRVEFKVLNPQITWHNSKHTGKYYIVDGSFSNKLNAQKQKENLTKLGLKPFVLEPDETNKFFRVVLAETEDYEEAYQVIEGLKAKVHDQLWVLS